MKENRKKLIAFLIVRRVGVERFWGYYANIRKNRFTKTVLCGIIIAVAYFVSLSAGAYTAPCVDMIKRGFVL